VTVLLAAGCTGDPEPAAPTPTPSPTPTVVGLTFDQAVAALTSDLVPTAEVRPCEEHEPGSPQAQAYLDRAAAGLETAPATPEEATAPAPPSCGVESVEAVRAASITGFAHGPEDELELPVAGGAVRVVEVYELAGREVAADAYAQRVADPDGWARDQEIPAEELEAGRYQARRVVSAAAVAAVDVPGWTATVMSRDEASFTQDGSPASNPVSYAYVWAVRDALVVRVQVAGDEPGAAAASATTTARTFAAAVEGTVADG